MLAIGLFKGVGDKRYRLFLGTSVYIWSDGGLVFLLAQGEWCTEEFLQRNNKRLV